jgi:hypothetical protein
MYGSVAPRVSARTSEYVLYYHLGGRQRTPWSKDKGQSDCWRIKIEET